MQKQEETEANHKPQEQPASAPKPDQAAESQTSYDGPLDKVEGEINNGELGGFAKADEEDKKQA